MHLHCPCHRHHQTSPSPSRSQCTHGRHSHSHSQDVAALNSQEGGYRSEVLPADLYGAGGPALEVEVYLPKTPPALAWPEGCCSARYRAILVEGAKEAGLAPAWIAKLQNLAVYEPSAATLALRDAVYANLAVSPSRRLSLRALSLSVSLSLLSRARALLCLTLSLCSALGGGAGARGLFPFLQRGNRIDALRVLCCRACAAFFCHVSPLPRF